MAEILWVFFNFKIFDFELSMVDMRRLEALDKGEAGRSFPGFPRYVGHGKCIAYANYNRKVFFRLQYEGTS